MNEAKAIKEIYCSEWLANTVMVKKKKKEGMCRFHGFEPSMSKRPIPYAED